MGIVVPIGCNRPFDKLRSSCCRSVVKYPAPEMDARPQRPHGSPLSRRCQNATRSYFVSLHRGKCILHKYGCPIGEVLNTHQWWRTEIYLVCENICTVRRYFSPRKIYISGAPKHLYECLCRYSWASMQIFWLAWKCLVYPQKCIHCPRKIMCCAEIFSMSCANFLFARGNY